MSYRAKDGQTMLDVMLQNKGELRGLGEFFHEITSLTQVFTQNDVFSITKELVPTVDNYDRKDFTVVSDSVVEETVIFLVDDDPDNDQLVDEDVDNDELINV